MNNNNGLEISPIQSRVKNLGDFKLPDNESFMSIIISNFEGHGYCVCYLDYKVLIGEYDRSSFQFYEGEKFEPRFIQRMRLFNEIQELYIWRKNNGWFSGRLRVDGEGNNTDVVEAYQVLWGTDCEHISGFSRIYEDRGTELFLPFENMTVDKNEKKAFIKTHNYISYKTEGNSYQQAGYVDCRFVAFTDYQRKPLGVV